MRSTLLLPALLASAALASPAAAEYIVFQDGRSLKVKSYRFEAGETWVELRSGGSMRFTSAVVKYVAPDEDVESEPALRLAAAGLAVESSFEWEEMADPRWVPAIRRSASEHQLDPALVAAVIKVESDFRPHAVSPKGAMGLMQLMPGTARDQQLRDPFDPEANIAAGSAYLSKLLSRYEGDATLALAAYNAGPGRVDRLRRIPDIAETRQYVSRVLGWLERLGPG